MPHFLQAEEVAPIKPENLTQAEKDAKKKADYAKMLHDTFAFCQSKNLDTAECHRILEENIKNFGISYEMYQENLHKMKDPNSFVERLRLLRLTKTEWLAMVLAAAIPSAVSILLSEKINPNFRLQNMFSGLVPVGQTIMFPALVVNSGVEIIKPGASMILAAPLIEEYLMRELFQGQLLTHLPKRLLKKLHMDPKYVDLLPVRIARVLLTSILFAVGHKLPDMLISKEAGPNKEMHEGREKSGYYPQFVGGIILSTIKEATGSTRPAVMYHSIFNATALVFAISRGHLNEQFDKQLGKK